MKKQIHFVIMETIKFAISSWSALKVFLKPAVVILFATIALCPLQNIYASVADCKVEYRNGDPLFQALPKEIIGWINCIESKGDALQNLNITYIVKLDQISKQAQLDERTVAHWFKEYAKVVVPGQFQLNKVNSRADFETGRTVIFETKRKYGSISHFLFAIQAIDGTHFLLVNSDISARALSLSGKIRELGKAFGSSEKISAIASELP